MSVASEANTLLYSHFCLYIYSVTKILHKIRATTFTENYGKLRVMGDERTLLQSSLSSATLYQFATRYNSMVDKTETSKTFGILVYTKQTSKTFL